jgi:polysaccharide biosynthesis/export protein
MRKLLYFGVLVLAAGCKTLNPSIMLVTKDNFNYSQYKDSANSKEYKISTNDIIEFKMYANDGFKLIDLTSFTGQQIGGITGINYLVEPDGKVKLPVLGRIQISGYTVKEAENMLEEKYASSYVKPFIILHVVNKRVIVFPGSPGSARVITLQNNNTTLIEALALSGGISENGKAHKIKLIRKNIGMPEKPDVYLIDLSTINGIKYSDLVLQADDIIYVEPRRNVAGQILREISPILALLSTSLLVYSIFVK